MAPWFSHESLVGHRVWVLEWTPVAVVTTVTARCGDHGGAKPGKPRIDQRTVRQQPALGFWPITELGTEDEA